MTVPGTATTGLVALAVFVLTLFAPASAQDLVGIPLNKKGPVTLGDDLGFGKSYRPSLTDNYQDWGLQSVSSADGFPTRLGERSLRFETREGYCGRDGSFWDDCANGRNRHELSAHEDPDPWDKEVWYALSLYIPAEYETPTNVGTSIFQWWAGGRDSWMFRYRNGRGFYVERKLDNTAWPVVPDGEVLDRWIDLVVRIRHSLDDRGSFTVWADGKRVFRHLGRSANGDDRARLPYFKFGIYNTGLGSDGQPIGTGGNANGENLPNLHLFFDEVRYGSNCRDLQLEDLGYDCTVFTHEGADKAQIAELQQALNELGCDVGTADGVIGPRTLAAALGCRYFEDSSLPDDLTAANLPMFLALYTDAETAALPKAPPNDRVEVANVVSELVGGNKDNALTIRAAAEGLSLNFIVIGRFDDNGSTNWLDILLEDDLGQPVPTGLSTCRRVRTETWGDGSVHAVIQFSPRTDGYRADGADCLLAVLPPELAREAEYLLTNFGKIATAVAASEAGGIPHPGVRAFVDRAANGAVTIAAAAQ